MTFPKDADLGGLEVQSAAWGPDDSVVSRSLGLGMGWELEPGVRLGPGTWGGDGTWRLLCSSDLEPSDLPSSTQVSGSHHAPGPSPSPGSRSQPHPRLQLPAHPQPQTPTHH